MAGYLLIIIDRWRRCKMDVEYYIQKDFSRGFIFDKYLNRYCQIVGFVVVGKDENSVWGKLDILDRRRVKRLNFVAYLKNGNIQKYQVVDDRYDIYVVG